MIECALSLRPRPGRTPKHPWPKRGRIFRRDHWRCRYCNVQLNWRAQRKTTGAATLDHIMPLSRGGWQSDENVVTACNACNRRKVDRTPDEAGMPVLPIYDDGLPKPWRVETID